MKDIEEIERIKAVWTRRLLNKEVTVPTYENLRKILETFVNYGKTNQPTT